MDGNAAPALWGYPGYKSGGVRGDLRGCWGSGQEPHHEGWGRSARAARKSLKEQKCPDRNPRRVRPMKPIPGGDPCGRHAGVSWHSRGPAGLLKNHANTSVKRLKAAEGQVLRAPGRPGGHGGLGKACVNLALVLT